MAMPYACPLPIALPSYYEMYSTTRLERWSIFDSDAMPMFLAPLGALAGLEF